MNSRRSAAVTLVATARSITGSLQQAVEVDGGHHLITDEPPALGGDGTAASPHELLPAALAACVSTQLLMYARTKDWELGDVSVRVDYDHRSTPRRFEIDIVVEAPLTQSQLDRLHKVAVGCPVRRALEGGAEFSERLAAHGVERAA
jgi:putative redox protein